MVVMRSSGSSAQIYPLALIHVHQEISKVEEVCNQESTKNGTYIQTVLLSIEDNKNGPSV